MQGDGLIVKALFEIQERFGYLPKPELEAFAARNPDYPLHRVHEVASCFPHFRLDPPQGVSVKVCRDMACHLAGSPELRAELEASAAEFGAGAVEVGGVSCLGRCDAAPAVMVGERVFGGMYASACADLIRDAVEAPEEFAHVPPPEPSEPTGWLIDPYLGRAEYGAVRKFVEGMTAEALIRELEVADLRGMGGAGVWAHLKWNDVRQARGDTKYVVCNGDESEPSTFKDRELLLRTPHVVLEGVILGGLVVGAERGYIYIRHEYGEQIAAMNRAIAEAEALGVCGPDATVLGRPFPVEVFVSPGGYICGEQSALIEAMEGKRAEPRNKPPQLETNGLYDRPTLLSNVETFAWVPAIVMNGGAWYRNFGRDGYKGLRFFSICGDLNRPGVYEVPIGMTLRGLVVLAGGLSGGQKLKAFAPSGPSGGFLPAKIPLDTLTKGFEKRVPEFAARRIPPGATHLDVLDLELDLDLFRALGLMLGAGMVVYGDRADMLDQAKNATEFFRNESCGKCVPCRIGSTKTAEIAADLAGTSPSRPLAESEALADDLRRAMEMTSICGLGMVAASPLASVFRYFRDDLVNRPGPRGTVPLMTAVYSTAAFRTAAAREKERAR
jgi:NADH:ubiquinone oxidoreductase subunit F (NADH-binding)/NADH:ubiquinone oxidoreductase subunit E